MPWHQQPGRGGRVGVMEPYPVIQPDGADMFGEDGGSNLRLSQVGKRPAVHFPQSSVHCVPKGDTVSRPNRTIEWIIEAAYTRGNLLLFYCRRPHKSSISSATRGQKGRGAEGWDPVLSWQCPCCAGAGMLHRAVLDTD
ncbi:hypothetical protein AOLI_G00057380 [Acnodon oligacanthus]